MTRMTGPDCAVMCNLINTHTHTHTRSHSFAIWFFRRIISSTVPGMCLEVQRSTHVLLMLYSVDYDFDKVISVCTFEESWYQ